MEEKKKSNGGLIVLVIILLLACVGMGTFIFINKDKIMSKESTTVSNTEKKGTTDEIEKEETINNQETTNEKNNTIETRSCIGTYSGQGAVTQDARTGEKTNGTITIDLKEDGTYKLTKSGMDQYWAGHYTIIENALLLKEGPSTCGPGADCSEKYSSFLNLSDDCSKIVGGYGSVFFDSNFTLMKNS